MNALCLADFRQWGGVCPARDFVTMRLAEVTDNLRVGALEYIDIVERMNCLGRKEIGEQYYKKLAPLRDEALRILKRNF